MVAADGRKPKRHQSVGGFRREKRSRNDVSEVQDHIHAPVIDIRDHRFERR